MRLSPADWHWARWAPVYVLIKLHESLADDGTRLCGRVSFLICEREVLRRDRAVDCWKRCSAAKPSTFIYLNWNQLHMKLQRGAGTPLCCISMRREKTWMNFLLKGSITFEPAAAMLNVFSSVCYDGEDRAFVFRYILHTHQGVLSLPCITKFEGTDVDRR